MSLSKCLGKIKLNDSLKTLINKEIDKNKKAKVQDPEMMAIESLIDISKQEIDYVREKIGGDIGKVQFEVSNEDVGPVKVTTKDGKVFYQFAGRKSLTSNEQALSEAAKLESENISMEEIRNKTGWFKGPDNRWRYEISDEKASFKDVDLNKKRKYKLSDVLNHVELFNAYPELKNINVEFGAHRGLKGGHFDRQNNTIKINVVKVTIDSDQVKKLVSKVEDLMNTDEYIKYKNADYKKMTKEEYGRVVDEFRASNVSRELSESAMQLSLARASLKSVYPNDLNIYPSVMSIALHEIQHAIQGIEGFARGTNSQAAGGFKNYQNTLGEIEARNTEARRILSNEGRLSKTPDIQISKRPIINWGDVSQELPIDFSKKDPFSDINKDAKSGDQLKFFQNQQDPNASIQFREDGTTIVRLFKSANASSFMHEMGHLFLQRRFDRVMSGDASTKEINQFKKLGDFLGYNPEKQNKLTVEQHEKFAQAFEQYIKEGKSPVRGLKGVFTKFRKWLTNIYGAAKVGGIEITPEIREVMDGMVTTERLIQLAKLENGQAVSSIEQILGEELTDKVKDRLITLKERAEELAFSRVFKEQYKKTTKEYKDNLELHKKELIKQFTNEVNDSELGKTIDIQKEILGTDKLKRFAQKIIDNKLKEDEKLKAEIDAERLGFTSADHMAKVLLEQPTKEEMVNELVNQEMARIESEKDPAFIKKMVDEKIRNESSTELLALEKELLIEMASKENNKELERIADAMEKDQVDLINEWLNAKELNEQRKKFEKKLDKQKIGYEKEKSRLSERFEKKLQTEKQRRIVLEWRNEQDAEKRKFLAKQFRDTAKFIEDAVIFSAKTEAEIVKRKASELLSKKPFREASRFTKYFNAEKIAALKVAKAIDSGDFEGALKAKHEQMMNHALAKESVRISKLTTKQTNFLNDLRTLNKDNWKNEDHWLQGSKILSRFGFVRSDFDPGLIEETLETYAARYGEMGFEIDIPDWIANETTTRDLSALTVNELQDVVDLLKNIRFIANVQNKLLKIEAGANIQSIQEKLIETSKANVADKKRIKLEFYPNASEKVGSFFRSKFNALKTMETMLYVFDKYKDFGTWSNVFVKSITHAANDESVIVKGMLSKFDEIYSNYSPKELKKFRTEKVFIDSLQVSLTKETLLSIALNLGNTGNKERLYSKAPVGIAEHLWTEQNIILAIEKNLDERDWKFVQETWDHIDSYWPQIKKLHRDVTGFSPGKIDADEFDIKTKTGNLIKLKGGYYPLASDTRSNITSENRELADGPLYTEKNPAWKAATKKNFTKQRASQAKYAVKLNLDVMHEHLFNVAHDLAFRKTIIDLNRITNSPELQTEIESVIGRDGNRSLTEYIKSAAMKDPEMLKTGDIMDSVIRNLRSSTSKYMLAANLKNIIQNLANISIYGGAVQGFSHIDSIRAMIKGLPDQAKIMIGERPIHEFVSEKSSFMRDRGDSPEFSIKESAGEKFGEGSKLNRVAQSLMAFTDNMTAEPIWIEAYYKKLNEGANEKDAIDFADTLIRRSIGSGRRYDQAAIYRSGELTKMFMMFSSFLNVQYNRFARETGAIIEEKDAWRALTLVGSQMIFIVSSAVLTGKFGADDDDEERKKTLVQELTNYPMSMIPILRDVGPIVMDRLVFDRPSTGLRNSPALEVMNASLGAVNAIASENTTEAQKLEAVVKVPMMATGTPKQFSDWFWNGFDIANGMDAKPSDLYRRRPKKER